MLLVTATVDAARSREAVETISAELDRLRAGDGDLAEAFVRARRKVVEQIVAHGSGAESAADRIGSLVAHGERLDANARLAREVMDLTMMQVRSALAADLAVSREIVGLIGSSESIAAARRVIDR